MALDPPVAVVDQLDADVAQEAGLLLAAVQDTLDLDGSPVALRGVVGHDRSVPSRPLARTVPPR
jgi:hypothetical protein